MGNSKQRLKGNSALEIFAENFPCCQKIREARVVYRLKRHLIIYLHAACWVVKIQMAAAVKASHNQLPFIGKQASMEVADQNHSLGGILQNAVLQNFVKFM